MSLGVFRCLSRYPGVRVSITKMPLGVLLDDIGRVAFRCAYNNTGFIVVLGSAPRRALARQ